MSNAYTVASLNLFHLLNGGAVAFEDGRIRLVLKAGSAMPADATARLLSLRLVQISP